MDQQAESGFVAGIMQQAQRNARLRHRQLVCLSGDREWSESLVLTYLKELNLASAVWVGTHKDLSPNVSVISSKQARRYLGTEQQCVIVDAWEGFDPDGVGALAGTVLPGGFLFLLVPKLSEWAEFADPVVQRLLSEGRSAQCPSPYLARLASRLSSDSEIIFVEESAEPSFPSISCEQIPASKPQSDGIYASQDQADAVAAICHVVKGHRRRPLVMTADRGRGKSAALGLAAAQLLISGCRNIVLTAPSPAVVSNVFAFAQRELDQAVSDDNRLTWNDGVLRFVAPDDLLETLPSADLLMIDEAAAIPVPLLLKMVSHYSRVAFSSTVHGYEGTGRGFGLRFQKALDRLAPQWRALELTQPVRWNTGDPLEASINSLLLLDAEAEDSNWPGAMEVLDISWVDQSELSGNEALLSQVFGLLVQAHYQTSPMDLRQLLDSPDLRIAVASQDSAIIGVLLLVEEGPIELELEEDIFNGIRRPRGHLVLQTLMAHAGLRSVGGLCGFRVMRIAVNPDHQGQGLGTALLQRAFDLATAESKDYVASSFGASDALLRFWGSASYSPLHIGSRRNAATGEHSVVVLRPVSEQGQMMMQAGSRQFQRHLLPRLRESLRNLSPEVLLELLKSTPSGEKSDASELAIVTAFARAKRSFEASEGALYLWLSQRAQGLLERDTAIEMLIAKVLQGLDWQTLANNRNLPGRKAVEAKLREAVSKLLKAE